MNPFQKVFTAVDHLKTFWSLFKDLDPQSSDGIRIWGKPSFKGGPSTKRDQLETIASRPGEAFSTIFCFSAVRVPTTLLRLLKWRGARLLVNQNGVGYPAWNPNGYRRMNRFQRRLSHLADHVFFQSAFAKRSFEDWVSQKPTQRPKNYSILYNGVDLERFTPSAAPLSRPLRILVFTDVSVLNAKLWKVILDLISKVDRENPALADGIKWVFMGRVLDAKVFENVGLKNLNPKIETFWNAAESDVPQHLRDCHLALHLVYNDVCPNKVLECMASGLRVIAGSSGGTPELIAGSGLVLDVVEGYGEPVFPDAEKLLRALKTLVAEVQADLPNSRKRARERAERFGLKTWLNEVRRLANHGNSTVLAENRSTRERSL